MVAALKKNGVPVWYVVGTNEGHGFAKKANQDYLQAVEVMFLRRYLLGRPMRHDGRRYGRVGALRAPARHARRTILTKV